MELEKNSKLYLSDNISMIPPEKSKEKENLKNSSKTLRYALIIIITIIFLILVLLYNYNKNPIKEKKFNNSINNNLLSNKEEIKYEIDSNYERVSAKGEKYIYIPIISTNDFHGKFFPEIKELNLDSKKIEYKMGGLEYISKYITTLRNEFGENKVLYFDSGDQYFISNETVFFKGRNILDFLNTIGLNGTTLGNHEFLYKRKWLENIIKKSKYPYLINNIRDIVTNKTEKALGDNQLNSYLYEIKLNNNESDIIKIGVIGITMTLGEDKRFYNIGNRATEKLGKI